MPCNAKCFPKMSASTQNQEGGDNARQTQLGFRTGIKAECTDQLQPAQHAAFLLQPWLYCPLVAKRGPAGRFYPKHQQGLENLGETRFPPLQLSAPGLVQPLLQPFCAAPNSLLTGVNKRPQQLPNADCRRCATRLHYPSELPQHPGTG